MEYSQIMNFENTMLIKKAIHKNHIYDSLCMKCPEQAEGKKFPGAGGRREWGWNGK